MYISILLRSDDFPMIKRVVNWIANSRDWMSNFNHRFDYTRYALIDKTLFPYVESFLGQKFVISPNLITFRESFSQYIWTDIRPGNKVIDIGANIGAFSLIAAKLTDDVHAFEPITYHALWLNVNINNKYDSIKMYEVALGNGEPTEIEWEGVKKTCITLPLGTIISSCGGCDFLKCDAEGAEWNIDINDLKKIRRIEIEFHNYTPNKDHHLLKEIAEYYNFTTDYNRYYDTYWVHGTRKADV